MVIIDEAHNLPQVIEDASSFKLDTTTFVRVLVELKKIQELLEKK